MEAAPSVALVAHWDWVLYNFRVPLARRLAERGARVTLICPPGRYTDALQNLGFRWLPWSLRRRSLNPIREAKAIWALRQIYRQEQFAAVQHFTAKPILYGAVAATGLHVPVVINTFTGLGFLFSDDPRAAVLRLVVFPLVRRLLRRPEMVTVVQNPGDSEHLAAAGLVPPRQLRLIAGSGVDLERFAPRDAAEPAIPLVLLAARLLRDKGIGEFVEAARALRRAGVQARFVVAGLADKGNPRCIPATRLAQWAEEGVVEFIGHCEDMPGLLRSAHIAVLPSYYEGVPRFLLEAAATGLPLIASDIPGCRLVIEPGVNGFLVPPRDAGALSAAIRQLLADHELRRRMGKASRAVALERFDLDRIVSQYEELYQQLGVLRSPSA